MQLKLQLRSPKRRHEYHQDPATICSAVNYRLQNISPRLASSLAVNAIIGAIRKRQVIHRLYLGASSLGDAGCIRLFEFLTSPAGSHCRECLTELFLTKNEIGAQGLLAVAGFLKGNTVLRELCLSGNPLTTNPDIIAEFTSALNSSRLCTLQILHSSSLGDPFAQTFLPQLTTPYLRELDLSAINMTQATVPALAGYVRSTRCHLHRLQCNANGFTLTGARMVVNAIKENYSLRNVRLDDLHLNDHTSAVVVEDKILGWQECNRVLSTVLRRNSALIVRVKDESLALLCYSRALFLRSRRGGVKKDTSSFLSQRRGNAQLSGAPSLFFDLPAELQQEIISYIAPSLSHQQRMRIIYFAADTTTLFYSHPKPNGPRGCAKQLELRFKTAFGRWSPDQQGKPFEGSWRPPTWWECHCSTDRQPSCRCLCRWKREMRDMWLTQVSCNVYEHAL